MSAAHKELCTYYERHRSRKSNADKNQFVRQRAGKCLRVKKKEKEVSCAQGTVSKAKTALLSQHTIRNGINT